MSVPAPETAEGAITEVLVDAVAQTPDVDGDYDVTVTGGGTLTITIEPETGYVVSEDSITSTTGTVGAGVDNEDGTYTYIIAGFSADGVVTITFAAEGGGE